MTVWIGLIVLGLGLGGSLFMPVPQNLKTNFDAAEIIYVKAHFDAVGTGGLAKL